MSNEKRYEYVWRNKFITTEAATFDDIINGLEGAVAHLKELKATGKVEYVGGAEDDYAHFETGDEDVAKRFHFWEIEDDEEEDFDDETEND